MIEDEELRSLFQAESEEHLQNLDEGLLRLENNPRESATLEEMFRAAHSLKGTARMLGVEGVETLAHHLEDELGKAKRGRLEFGPADIDRMCLGVDAIRQFAESAVTGQPVQVDLAKALAQLRGAAPSENSQPPSRENSPPPPTPPQQSTATQPPLPPPAERLPPPIIAESDSIPKPSFQAFLDRRTKPVVESESPQPFPPQFDLTGNSTPQLKTIEEEDSDTSAVIEGEVVADNAPKRSSETATVTVTESSGGEFRIQTMRIPPARLDGLMTLASELTVTTNRVERGLATFDAMGELWDEWHKELSAFRIQSARWQNTWVSNRSASDIQQLDQFQAQELERVQRMHALWQHLRDTLYEDATRLSFVADQLEEGIRNIRLLPLTTIFGLYPRMVRDLSRSQSKEIQLLVQGGETAADKRILEEMKDPLMHMIRNAIDHGIEPIDERERVGKPRLATIVLRARQTATNVIIQLEDDGRGLNVDAIKSTALKRRLITADQLESMSREEIYSLIFSPGFSTSTLVTDVSGRGVGMDVVRNNVERLKGSIQVDSRPGKGTTFSILLPLTLATTRVLLVDVTGMAFAIPVEFVSGAIQLEQERIFTIEGRQTFVQDGEAIPLARLANLLELRQKSTPEPRTVESSGKAICVVIGAGTERLGLIVDGLVDEQEVMLKPLGPLLKRVRNVSSVTILGAGEVCMILNPQDLIRSAHRSRTAALNPMEIALETEPTRRKLILLAEDSITTRTQEKRILEGAGYEVVTAVDGADAFQKLPSRDFDAVVSDVEMPNMTGLDLAARIRQDKKYVELPIILVTSLASDEDKRRGVEVGANAYITKGTFEQKVLLDTLRRLV